MKKTFLALLLFIAFLRGSLYALMMPPWGLLDESAHFDYILKVAESGRPPVVGKDLLDSNVIDSILQTERHKKFHWPSPTSSNANEWGIEGNSYEGYQGLLYYYLNVPFFITIPGGILDKLFGLRLVGLLLSLITIWSAFHLTKEIFPENPNLSYWVAILFFSIPERTISTGRLSNDILLEVISILFLWVFTRFVMHGASWKRTILFALLAGLGLITKLSFAGLIALLPIAFFIRLRCEDKGVVLKGVVSVFIIALISIPYFINNKLVYGDWTGFKGFADLYPSNPAWSPPFQFNTAIDAAWQMFCSFWIVWWKGAESVTRPFLILFWVIMFCILIASLVGYARETYIQNKSNQLRFWLLVVFLGQIIVFLGITEIGYFKDKFPVIQGRFLNPVFFPIILVLCLGLQRITLGKPLFFIMCSLLIILDGLYLFGNLLPFHYYYSSFYDNGVLIPHQWNGWNWAASLFLSNFMSDKPAWVLGLVVIVLVLYVLLCLAILWVSIYLNRKQRNVMWKVL